MHPSVTKDQTCKHYTLFSGLFVEFSWTIPNAHVLISSVYSCSFNHTPVLCHITCTKRLVSNLWIMTESLLWQSCERPLIWFTGLLLRFVICYLWCAVWGQGNTVLIGFTVTHLSAIKMQKCFPVRTYWEVLIIWNILFVDTGRRFLVDITLVCDVLISMNGDCR